MFLLLGIVTIFLILNSFLQSMLNLPSLPQAILAGILEMTQGVKLISALEISELLKVIIITMILSFGGFSVHMQVLGIISDAKIKYKPFLLALSFTRYIKWRICIYFISDTVLIYFVTSEVVVI